MKDETITKHDYGYHIAPKKTKKLGMKAKKYSFTGYVETNDKAWPTDKRNEWAEKARLSHEKINSLHGSKIVRKRVKVVDSNLNVIDQIQNDVMMIK